ncbi:MAG TPA: protein-glutamate O-methyltransferase [Bacteroidales bacterium]|nr:protein-glutamate O-methyltransferase [Bacteroidales bacterium]
MEQYINGAYKCQMTDKDFNVLSAFVYEELGIKMPYVKKIMLQSRLQRRLSELKMSSFREYIDFVFSKEGQKEEIIKMIDVITTNKTDFFREPSHFDYLTESVLPEYQSEQQARKPLRIWSAGCSSGEEPYTIAIVLKEYIQNHHEFDFEIFATDLSYRILQKASLAIYSEERVSSIPYDLKRKYFLKSKDSSSKTVRVVPDIRSKVTFQRLNFIDNHYAVEKTFDIIFCRNVLIYFDRATQQDVITKLSSKLRPDGYFFLGHSESITNMKVPLRQIKPTIFRKTNFKQD